MKRLTAFGLLLLCVCSVSACGKKPVHVDPPDDVQNDTFPAIYPNPKLNK